MLFATSFSTGGAVNGKQRPVLHAQLHAGSVQVELTGQNLSHSRYLLILKFRLIFRSGTKSVSLILEYWQAMRVAIHTQIRQAMRVLIHTHISCRLLVEGSAPKPL